MPPTCRLAPCPHQSPVLQRYRERLFDHKQDLEEYGHVPDALQTLDILESLLYKIVAHTSRHRPEVCMR